MSKTTEFRLLLIRIFSHLAVNLIMEYEGCTEQAERIKSLLHGSSSKNPTCVLGTVLADFKSQGHTELTVSLKSYLVSPNHEVDDSIVWLKTQLDSSGSL